MPYITPKIYCVESAKVAHCFYLPEERILIDCGLPWEGKKIANEVLRIGKIDHIFITHADIDHVAGLNTIHDVTKATVWIGKDDVQHMISSKRPFPKNVIHKIFAPTLPSNYKTLEEWDNSAIRVIHTPGHSEGHFAFLYDGYLFIGDIYKKKNGVLVHAKKNENLLEREKSIKLICNIDCKVWLPSHGTAHNITRSSEQ